MKNDSQMPCEFAPEIPEFKKLGRRHFPGVTAGEFWQILFTIENVGIGILHENSGPEGFPAAIRKIYKTPLTFWQAFSWADVKCGVLRHEPSGLCRPLIDNSLRDSIFVGPALQSFTPESAARACWQVLQAYCSELGVAPPCANFVNHVPGFVSRDQIKTLFMQWSEDKSAVAELFRTAYTET